MTRLNTQFSVKGISLLNSVMASSSSVQFKSFCSIKSTILLEMKCPQLSKPEATAARNQNSIGDRTEKNLGREKPGSVGGPFLLWPDDTAVQFQLLQSQIGGSTGCRRSFPDGCLGDGGPHWGSVSGAHLGVLVSADVQGCRGRL